jgi:hypothetical protein
MRIAAAFLILIGIVLLAFGLISLDAHAPPETNMVAPFMIGVGLFCLIIGIVIAVSTLRGE